MFPKRSISTNASLSAFMVRTGIKLNNTEKLLDALTHPSFSREISETNGRYNLIGLFVFYNRKEIFGHVYIGTCFGQISHSSSSSL
jgi:hypothetical protein